MKRKLFIGSSLEGLSIAKELKAKVDADCGEWINSEIWENGTVFSLNRNTLHCLVRAARKFEYGILVATKDDIIKSRKRISAVPRDNVIFEMGMFLGSLGLTRAFLLVEQESKLPTDYNGVTVPYFQKGIKSSLDNAIKEIINAFDKTRLTYNLKPMPSAALALGYFENFIEVLARKRLEQDIDFELEVLLPKNLKDINAEILAYKHHNKSREVSIFPDRPRPAVFELEAQKNHYWDIPTTLSTLYKLMDILLPSDEIGINQEKQEWIEHELRNFKGTIEILAQKSTACKDRISFSFLN
ncbi:MAG TPA: TIR domain-containing protein [Bacteroidales bacterium]|nr:TIR domain-containing protein [Bacteroidales bacterium]